jgi:hypothetical protein
MNGEILDFLVFFVHIYLPASVVGCYHPTAHSFTKTNFR